MSLLVIFSIFMKNHDYEDPYHLYRINCFFMKVRFLEPRLIFMKIHETILMSVYRIDPSSLIVVTVPVETQVAM